MMAKYHHKEKNPHTGGHVFNIVLAVEELNDFTSQELSKLLRQSENYTIEYNSKTGSLIQIDMEKLALALPLHLIAMVVSRSEQTITLKNIDDHGISLKYFLLGVRLLHLFSDLSSRHIRFEQITHEELMVSEQVLDLVFYMLIILARHNQVNHLEVSICLLHSALVASTFHLLTSYISAQWQDLVSVLLSHPKVDIFIDVAIDVVRVDVKFLHIILSSLNTDILNGKFTHVTAERKANSICQHCEASLQFIVSLYQQKMFRDRVLLNKELCNNGVLSLVHSILDIDIPQCFKGSFEIMASLSRLKSKVLSILLWLCEEERVSFSYLDEVAGSSKSMISAKSLLLKILDLMKITLGKETNSLVSSLGGRKPEGLVLLTSMRLADIISDDTNFRLFFMDDMSNVLVDILSMPHELFLSSWCSKDSSNEEEDVVLDYNPIIASQTALASLSIGSLANNVASFTYPGTFKCIRQTSYAHHRTSYLVKIIANFHCFDPNISQETVRDLFLNQFCNRLHMDMKNPTSNSSLNFDLSRSSIICRNLYSLINYGRTLIPDLLSVDDVDLLSHFHQKMLAHIPSNLTESTIQESAANKVGDRSDFSAEDSHVLRQGSNYHANLHGDLYCTGSLSERRHGENDNIRFTKNLSTQEQISNKDGSIDAIQHSEKLDAICEPKGPSYGLMDVNQVIKNVNEGTAHFLMEEGKLSQMVNNINIRNIAKEQILNKDDNSIDANQYSEILQRREVEKLNSTCKFNNPNDGQMNADYPVKNSNNKGMGGDLSQMVGNIKEGCIIALMASEDDEKIEILQHTDNHPRKLRKRKYKIMNNKQITMIEKELVNEPDMQRNATLLKSWADKLSRHGSKLTPSQLKNWINNRKAKLARATRETRAQSEGGNNIPDQSIIAHFYDSAENGGGEKSKYFNSSSKIEITSFNDGIGTSSTRQCGPAKNPSASNFLQLKLNQFVCIIDGEGNEVGRGKIYQTEGEWHGKNLEDSRMCVVCIVELKVEKSTSVQWPSEYSGTTFEEAVARNDGNMRVVWNTSMIIPLVE